MSPFLIMLGGSALPAHNEPNLLGNVYHLLVVEILFI